MDTTLERQKYLAEQVVEKWFQDNHQKGLHLEQFDGHKLFPLMASHMRKLALDENFEPPEHVRTETLDGIFRAILKSGLITPVNPRDDAAEKAEAAQRKALEEEARRDVHYRWFYDTHSNQQNAEEARRNSDYGKWLDNEKRAGVKVPEAPASQSNLFVIRTINNGVVRYLASDEHGAPVLTRSQENAFPLGSARANYFAELLKKQGHITVDILPLNEPAPPELSDEELNKIAGNL